MKIRTMTLLSLLLSLCGCGAASEQPPIRIGMNMWPAFDLLWVAEHEGFIAEEGARVELLDFESLSDSHFAYERRMINAVATTSYDITRLTVPAEPAWVFDSSSGSDAILGRREIGSPSGLRGRRVGVELDSVGELVLAEALQAAGLTASDVLVVPTGQLSAEEAFSRGEVDAVVVYPPVLHRMIRDGNVMRLFDSSQMKSRIYDLLAFDPALARDRKEDIDALLRAYGRVLRLLDDNPERVYALIQQRQRIDREAVIESFKGMTLYDAGEQAALLQRGVARPPVQP